MTPYNALWASVLFQAIRDMDTTRRKTAASYIFSNRDDVGSMQWICAMLDLDYRRLQMLCTTREGRNKILKRKEKHEKQESDDDAE